MQEKVKNGSSILLNAQKSRKGHTPHRKTDLGGFLFFWVCLFIYLFIFLSAQFFSEQILKTGTCIISPE